MEELTLPWWKRVLRAAIGSLKSGFGLFGRTQPDVAAVEPVAEEVDEVQIAESIERSEPELMAATDPEPEIEELSVEEREPVVAEPSEVEPKPVIEEVAVQEPETHDEPMVAEVEPEIEAAVTKEPEVDVTSEEVTNTVDEERTTADPSTSPSTRFTRSGFAQDDNSLEEQEMIEIEAEEEIAETETETVEEIVELEDVNQPDEVAVEEIDEPEDIPHFDEPSVAANELVEAELVEVETVEAQEVVEEQESAHNDTMETVPEPVEEGMQNEDLSDVEQDEVMAKSIPEITNEIEEMKPLHEETIREPESNNTELLGTESLGVEAEQESVHESEPEVTSVEVAKAEAMPEAVAEPVHIEATVEPEVAPVTAAPAEHHPIKHAIKEDDDKSSPFSIIVSQVYEGPMDLLLDLIRKQDIDIYDIPIAKITQQFLAYVERLRASDMDMAGEFIYTASLLIHIKSKTLLPRAPSGQDDQFDDPRRELVERLLEHERFKNAAQMLQQKQMIEDATWTNPGLREFKGDAGTEPELAADTVDLVRVFQEILDRARNRPVINVEEDSVTVGQMIQFLGRRLNMEDKPIALRKLLAHTHSQRALVAMFLALLELVRLQAVLLRQDRLFSEIFIKKHEGFDTVMTEGFLAARDDWQ